MNILHRYLIRLFVPLFCLCLGSFASIYLVIDFLEKISRFTRYNATASQILLFYFWLTPPILAQLFPLAILMATVLTLTGLARNSELTAMQSAGISLARITVPLLFVSLVSSLMLLLAGETLIPYSKKRSADIENVQIRKKKATAAFKQENIWFKDKNLILRALHYDPEAKKLNGVTLWTTADNGLPLERLDALSAVHTSQGWIFEKGVQHRFEDQGLAARIPVSSLPIAINLEEADLKDMNDFADDMSFSSLRRYVRKLEVSGYSSDRFATLMHARIADPFAAFIMSILGIPFAVRTGRSASAAKGVGFCLMAGFAYFILNAVSLSMGQAGTIPPVAAAWTANLLFLSGGWWLMRRGGR